MVEPNKVLTRLLIAARSSLVKYTARASSMNFSVEALGAFLVADLVLDDPEFLVDLGEIGFGGAKVDGGGARVLPGFLQQRELVLDVRHLGRVAHARGLDAQDGDLVEQFAGGDRHLDIFHDCLALGLKANSSSSLAVTAATSIRSITPGRSIFVVQASSLAGLPRNFRAAAS